MLQADPIPGTVIENTANIYFDFNPPVITEPSVLVAEFSTGIREDFANAITLAPVPVSDVLRITSSSNLSMLRIISADGREVLTQRGRAAASELNVS